MSEFDDVITRVEVEFLAGLFPFLHAPIPPADEEPERCIECGRYAMTIHHGLGYCSWDAAEYLSEGPAVEARYAPQYGGWLVAGPSTLPTHRRERHNAARRAA